MAAPCKRMFNNFSKLYKKTCYCDHVRWFGQPAPQTHPHLLQAGEVTPGISQDEYRHRRHLLIEKIKSSNPTQCNHHIVIIPSATQSYMSHDISYIFRQNTDFLYFCGFQEPDSMLLLLGEQSKSDHSSVLFVPKQEPRKELWEGKRSGVTGSLELTGVDQAFNFDELEQYLRAYLKDTSAFVVWYDYFKPAHPAFNNKIVLPFLGEKRHKSFQNPREIYHSLRCIKSAAELKLMEASCTIAGEAFCDVMKFSHPNVNESHLYAKMDMACRLRDAQYLAYIPVVAGGNRANTIHYIKNDQLIKEDELVLMDAGCEFNGYASDITRTWPVSGSFTPAQREVYEAVYEIQQACIELCTPAVSLDDIHKEMIAMIGRYLQKLNILPKNTDHGKLTEAAREFCPHHVSHYLGMDVHDTDKVSRHKTLEENMIVTIEPGIYLPVDNKKIPEKYRGIGIRIEDDICITNTKPYVLSRACPKSIKDLEKTIQNKHKG